MSYSPDKILATDTISTMYQKTNAVMDGVLYIDGMKQDTITGAASTITSSNLTQNKVVVSDSSGKIAVSSVSTTEVSYVSGVTAPVQTQINNNVVMLWMGVI